MVLNRNFEFPQEDIAWRLCTWCKIWS